MTGILRKVLPFGDPIRKNKERDEDFSLEFSIALEYNGPPVAYDIPRAFPVVVGEIPTADTLPLWSGLLDASFTVIQPIKQAARPGEDGGRKFEVVGLPRNSEESNGKFESTSIESEGSPRYREDELSDDSSASRGSPHEFPVIGHEKRPSAATFRDSNSVDTFDECSFVTDSEVDNILGKPKAQNSGKKGSCYRCQRGSRFTKKEACLVCDAKYCCHCLLRAMGSMAEGRKCLLCTGFRIEESKRDSLGKCSRMMKQLLPKAEIKHVMRSEISCAVNQLSPKLFFVNNRPLDKHQLLVLQSCLNPPKNLTPGYYWYDRIAGFWGKAGKKPSQIISEQLNIGGHIEREASNGNTDVLINGREITKEELWMLKAAGIGCRGRPHFWVSPDGSYQEEGQKSAKGKIWENAKTKILCRILSLPYPSDTDNLDRGEVKKKNNVNTSIPRKLLLIGSENSGTSTVLKQTKMSYGDPFTEEERRGIKLVIQSKLYCYLGLLIVARERFEKEWLREKEKGKSIIVEYEPGNSGCGHWANDSRREKGKGLVINQSRPTPPGKTIPKEAKSVYAISSKLKASSDWLLGIIAAGNIENMAFPASEEYSGLIDELWKDEAIQATYNRRNELEELPRVATYFLERAMEILKEDYEPSDMDILYAEGIFSSNGVVSTNFSFPKSVVSGACRDTVTRNDDLLSYQLIRLHPNSLGENCKWLEMFEDVDIVLFCVSLTDYDEFFDDDGKGSTNKMLASRNLFQKIVTHPAFYKKDFLLLLNKFDLFEEKIERVSLTKCKWFNDFNPVISHNHHRGNDVNGSPSLAQRAFQYIAVKFKRHFRSLVTGLEQDSSRTRAGRHLYVSLVTGLEQDTVKESLLYAREIIDWQEEDITLINGESSVIIEASTS